MLFQDSSFPTNALESIFLHWDVVWMIRLVEELLPVPHPGQLLRPSEPFACQGWIRENLEVSSLGGWESQANHSPFPSLLSEPAAASLQNPEDSDISLAFPFPLEETWLGPSPLSRYSRNDRFNGFIESWWWWLSWCYFLSSLESFTLISFVSTLSRCFSRFSC